MPADTGLVRNHYNSRTGISVNLEQQITETLGVFARGGWADGTIEPWTSPMPTAPRPAAYPSMASHGAGLTIPSASAASSTALPAYTRPISTLAETAS